MGKKKNRLFAYTDGSCKDNPGIGGMAYIILNWDKSEILLKKRRFLDITTINQAELLATISSCEWFLNNCDEDTYLVVVTDSKYCSSGFNLYMDRWVKNGWRDTKMKSKSNILMWKKLYDLKKKSDGRIHFRWIKGHSGDKWNEMADTMSYEVWNRWLKTNNKLNLNERVA